MFQHSRCILGKLAVTSSALGTTLEYHRFLTRGSCWGYGQWIYFTAVEVQIIPAAVYNYVYMYWCWLERDKRATEGHWFKRIDRAGYGDHNTKIK